MRLALNGKNIDLTQPIRDYVEEKIGRIVKHNNQIMNIKVNLSVTKNPSVKKNHIAEVTCFLNGSVIKIKEDAESMYAAIDLLADRLDRKVKENKEKLLSHKTGKSIRTELEPAEEAISEEEIYDFNENPEQEEATEEEFEKAEESSVVIDLKYD